VPFPRLDTIRPSSIAIALIAAISLCVGWGLNATLVPGQYEWLGLFRIFWGMSHRPAFWSLCFAIWLAGVLDAPPLRHVLARMSTAKAALWIAASLATLLVVSAIPQSIAVESKVDAVAFSLLLPGFAFHAFAVPGARAARLQEARRLLWTAALALLACTLAGYAHTMLKGALFIATDPRDDLLWAADARLLGSNFYPKLAVFRIGHPAVTRVLDLAYIGLIQQLWWSLFYFYGSKDLQRARPYVLAMFIVYVVGPLTYYLVPSRGPVFAHPEMFADLTTLAPDSRHLSGFLLGQTVMTIAGSAHPMAPFGFIAAMPSLHVAQSLVMLIAMRQSALLCVFNGAMLLLTIAATTVLGWHYFVDDIAGAALGLACWGLAVVVIRRDRRQHVDVAATAA
jgi:hypothetical protein